LHDVLPAVPALIRDFVIGLLAGALVLGAVRAVKAVWITVKS
jgi:hypothetical protein